MRNNGKTHDKATLANRAKYQFEADSEDEAMEGEIEENLDALHRSAKTLHTIGNAMGDELDEQNKHINRIIGKVSFILFLQNSIRCFANLSFYRPKTSTMKLP
jgi:hypothetical protein